MPTTIEHIQDNSKWLLSDVVPVLAGPNGTVIVGENTISVSDLTRDPAYKGKTIMIMASNELQANIKNISDIISVNRQIQRSLLSKIHGSVLNADHALNGGKQSFEDYTKTVFSSYPTLVNDLVLTSPIPGILPLTASNQFQKYLDATQLLTKSGTPLKGKIAKTDKTSSDSYYYMEYPEFKVVEAFHQAYMANTQEKQAIDLSFVNELRFSGETDLIELNMNCSEGMTPLDLINITALKKYQLAGLTKISISNLNGNVRIVRNAFSEYNFQELARIEFRNISGRVTIEDGAFLNTNMPNLQSLVFDDITQGVMIQDNAFSGSATPKLATITFASIQNELTVGNNVFGPNLVAQVSNLGFQSNTGLITILDATLKSLVKFDFNQTNQNSGYTVYDDEFKWVKDKLCTIEGLVRSGCKTSAYGASPVQSSGTPYATILTSPKALSSSDKISILKCQIMDTKNSQSIVGFIFFMIACGLLYYAVWGHD